MYAVIFDTRNSANVRLCVSRGHSFHLPPPSPISPFPSKLSPSWDEIKEDVTINGETACETNRTGQESSSKQCAGRRPPYPLSQVSPNLPDENRPFQPSSHPRTTQRTSEKYRVPFRTPNNMKVSISMLPILCPLTVTEELGSCHFRPYIDYSGVLL